MAGSGSPRRWGQWRGQRLVVVRGGPAGLEVAGPWETWSPGVVGGGANSVSCWTGAGERQGQRWESRTTPSVWPKPLERWHCHQLRQKARAEQA